MVDLNRAGVPLLEIVSEPDMRNGIEAAEYAAELQRLVRYLGISNGNMQEGSLRCDVNVSIRPIGQSEFGTKVEIKNLNSFSSVSRRLILKYQDKHFFIVRARVIKLCKKHVYGKKVLSYNEEKEGLADYRYFPEPDLPGVILTEEYIEDTHNSLPELPKRSAEDLEDKPKRGKETTGYDFFKPIILCFEVAKFFDATIAKGAEVKLAANWIMGDIAAYMKNEKLTIDEIKLTPEELAELIASIKAGTISGKIGKEILFELLAKGELSKDSLKKGFGSGKLFNLLHKIMDPDEIEKMVDKVISDNPKQLEQYRGGKTKLQGYFAGQVMKVSKGKANPGLLNKILLEKLNAKS
ncbi:hypothetical protein FNV43_RR00092 [Rhamnella rubrinervis]|uniref:Asn/Gln amidotransferase domain-containing protein n=1 Tax=Rhamnella rubrinervis TaxID=2594499 RepID=A0A8K0MS26_9ROSA|nr:hypothetical protein FNV43_RR00092 [Rhamnella rubrinervis]